MRTLVYKRTHRGDPDKSGVFGCNGCMGRVRAWPFEAVVGVGGVGDEPIREGIAYKLTWVGVGARTKNVAWWPDPVVVFDHFGLFDDAGEDFRELAPLLAHRIYTRHIRATMTFTPAEAKEVKRLLTRARKWPPSPALGPEVSLEQSRRRSTRC